MISVSLNVDLVAGKAFLAGGGSGEWEELQSYTISPSTATAAAFKMYINKSQKSLHIEGYLSNDLDTSASSTIYIDTGVFVGNTARFMIGSARAYEGAGKTKPMSGTCTVELAEGRIKIDGRYFLYNNSSGWVSNGRYANFLLGGIAYIQPQNWL